MDRESMVLEFGQDVTKGTERWIQSTKLPDTVIVMLRWVWYKEIWFFIVPLFWPPFLLSPSFQGLNLICDSEQSEK